MTIDATTPRDLQDAIRDAILTIVPREPTYSDHRWAWSGDNRDVGASLDVRLFHLEWVPGERVIGGLTGNNDYEMSATVVVVTHYRSIPARELGWLVTSDFDDLVKLLNDSEQTGLGTIRGLTWAEAGGRPTRADEEDAQKIEFPIAIQYQSSRST